MTGLFLKILPNRTNISKEEKSMPVLKPMNNMITISVCANASGDCKIKPMAIYHSENPRILRSNNAMKSKLPVMRKSCPKS